MKFGVTIPNNWGLEDPQEMLSFGPLAENLGYDSVWVMDHLFNNGYIRERFFDRLRPGLPGPARKRTAEPFRHSSRGMCCCEGS